MLEQVQTGMGEQIGYDQHHVDDLMRSYQDEQRQSKSSGGKKRKRWR